MTREEHLQWCKDRAIDQIDKTSGFAGWVGFKHDMQKHDETKNHIALSLGDQMLQMAIANAGGVVEGLFLLDTPCSPFNIRNFIEGFN